MMTFLNTFRKIGGGFDIDEDGIRFWHPGGDAQAAGRWRPTSTPAS